MSRTRLLPAVLALILAVFGTIGIVTYVNGAEQRALEGETLVDTYMVTKRIPQGTSGGQVDAYIRIESVPKKLVYANNVDSLDDIRSLVAEVELQPGELLTTTRFTDQQSFDRQASRVVDRPAGLQEVTISLGPDRAAGGLIAPGDTVGALFSFEPIDRSSSSTTSQALHKLLVTNVQHEQVAEVANREGLDDEVDRKVRLVPSGNLLVTLAVDVPTSERLIFAAEFGYIWLTNQPLDTPESPSEIQSRSTIYGDVDNAPEVNTISAESNNEGGA